MTSVLIVCGHVGIGDISSAGLCPGRDWTRLARSTGTRGEQSWTGDAGPRLAQELRAKGVDVTVTDAVFHGEIYGRDYDLAIALHLQRDRTTARAFAAAPNPTDGYISDAAQAKAQKWLARFVNEYSIGTGIPVTQDAVTINMTDLYGWCYLQEQTPAVIVECGNADVDAATIYEPAIARIVQTLALITLEYLRADLQLPMPPAPAPVPEAFPLSSFPVTGVWDGDPRALEAAVQSYSEGRAPIGFGMVLAAYARDAKVRGDVAAAQAMHETGRFRFDGTDPVYSAKPDWNNYGGLKTTDGSGTAHFPTTGDGIRALLAHISWYANPDHSVDWCNQQTDPRHFGAHKNNLHTLADFGRGVWNTGTTYGPAVARHLAEIRARFAVWAPPTPAPTPAARQMKELVGDFERGLEALEGIAREMRAATG